MTLHRIKNNLQSSTRRDVLDGQEHLVVPVVMIVDGVMNGALVTSEEYGKYVEAWNGRPVPVLHPERQGVPVSANQPDIIGRSTIGQLFNARVDAGKLKAEAWINTEKAKRLGYTDLLTALEAGEVVEVSTGYYSDSEAAQGEHNGEPYTEIHRNIRPDHLALLPGEIGACSVMDGCGTRVNNDRTTIMSKTRDALSTLAKALGFSANCNCEEPRMDILTQAETLKANGSLTAKQFQMLSEMDDDARAMVRALIEAMGNVTNEEPETPPEEPEEMTADPEVPANNQQVDIDQLVSNRVKEQLRRERVTDKLTANQACPFDEAELAAMPITHLEKLEKSIRPADYSGQGGFAANSDVVDSSVKPLTIHRGVLAAKEQ